MDKNIINKKHIRTIGNETRIIPQQVHSLACAENEKKILRLHLFIRKTQFRVIDKIQYVNIVIFICQNL